MKACLLICAGLMLAIRVAPGQTALKLIISPDDLVFSTSPVGVASAPLVIKISNPTNTSVELQEVIVSGIDFAQTNSCGKELAPATSCSIQVVFKPAITGERLGSLEIAASDSNVPHFVPLTGTGH